MKSTYRYTVCTLRYSCFIRVCYTFQLCRYIEDSLGSLATPVNFFMHNLAQFKFSGVSNAPTLLSFSPQAYSIETDGKVITAVIMAFHKRFYPDTHYVSYIMMHFIVYVRSLYVFSQYQDTLLGT